MRCVVCLLLGGLLVAGCAGPKARSGSSAANSSTVKSNGKVIITPDNAPLGKVARVNEAARFAVLNFPIGSVPPIGQSLNAYRQGLKVGELKVTGPQGDENTVADITIGDVRFGDEVRGY